MRLLPLVTFSIQALAFPFVEHHANLSPEIKRSLLEARQQADGGRPCPYNPPYLHVPAVPWNPQFPYNGARNGLPGYGGGGFQVPAPGDTAHRFIKPGPNDIRGPCPGLNTLANHGFVARDGIVTFEELLDAQQNVFNIGYDLAKILAVVAITHDGDTVTRKVSIGCDATSRTSWAPLITGRQPGFNGHNKFEMDTSLTRNDYFLGNGDNYSLNTTLFKGMADITGRNYDRDGIADWKFERYKQGVRDNPNFYFGPLGILLYGAASLVYETMPNGNRGYAADHETISSFFGVGEHPNGTFFFNNEERIPANWVNRATPYYLAEAAVEILYQYTKHPVLIGGGTGNGGFNILGIQNGTIVARPGPEAVCLIYQLATGFPVPNFLNGVLGPAINLVNFANDILGGDMENLGCPLPLV